LAKYYISLTMFELGEWQEALRADANPNDHRTAWERFTLPFPRTLADFEKAEELGINVPHGTSTSVYVVGVAVFLLLARQTFHRFVCRMAKLSRFPTALCSALSDAFSASGLCTRKHARRLVCHCIPLVNDCSLLRFLLTVIQFMFLPTNSKHLTSRALLS
jgi:hypothetical protein